MNILAEKVCELLELQEHTLNRVLEACKAKRVALDARDFMGLATILATLDDALEDASHYEGGLAELLSTLPGLNEKARFSTLVDQAEPEQAARMLKLKEQVKGLLEEVHTVSRENIELINNMLSDVEAAVHLLDEVIQAKSPTYSQNSVPVMPGALTEGFA